MAFSFVTMGQTDPTQNTQWQGNANNLLVTRGILKADSGFVNARFADTASANINSYLKYYAGSQIFTTSDNALWIRNISATRWLFVGNGTGSSTNTCAGLLSGGVVTWNSLLEFDVSAAIYCITNNTYNSASGTITLDAADPSLPRIDVIGVDTLGHIFKLTGTPAADPAVPQVDPASQLYLTNVLVGAGATTPTGVSQVVLWNENIGSPEYTGASTVISTNFNNTLNPYVGLKATDVGAWSSTGLRTAIDYSGTAYSTTTYNTLKFFIRLKSTLATTANLYVTLRSGGVAVTSPLLLSSLQGLNKSLTGVYQNISIPFTDFASTSFPSTIDGIRITTSGSNTSGFYLDYMTLNGGVTTGNTNYLTDVFASNDSLYKVKNGITTFWYKVTGGASTPTLQQVMAVGNSTNYPLNSTNSISVFSGDGKTIGIESSNSQNSINLNADISGSTIIMQRGNGDSILHIKSDLVGLGTKTIQFPNASGTIALTSDITNNSVTKLPLYTVTGGVKDTIKVYGVDSSYQNASITGNRIKLYRYSGDSTELIIPSGASGGGIGYYLNGSISAGVGTYKQMNAVPVIGAGTDFSKAGNGLIAQFMTDVADPSRLEIPAGAWNFEMFFNASSSGGTPAFYVDLLKYDGSTYTSIATGVATPEAITGGTTIDLYLASLAVPYTTLTLTDRLVVRVYIANSSGGRTMTLHTEDNTLCFITTTFVNSYIDSTTLSDSLAYYLPKSDTTNKWVQSVANNAGGDSLIVIKNGVRTANKYPSGGGGGWALGGNVNTGGYNSTNNYIGNKNSQPLHLITGTLGLATTKLFIDTTGNIAIPSSNITLSIGGYFGGIYGGGNLKTQKVEIGSNIGSGYGGIWFGGVTPSFSNYTFLSDGTTSFINSPSGQLTEFRINNATKMIVGTNGVSIGATTGTAPSATVALELKSTTQGFLPPRMTTTQRDAIASPATGLTVYNTTTNTNDTYLGGAWVNDLQSASPSFTGLLSGVGTTQTGSSAVGVVDLSQTWNTTGNVTGIKYNVTNTASGASSNLMDLQVGGVSKFKVDKGGATTISSNLTLPSGVINITTPANQSWINLSTPAAAWAIGSGNEGVSNLYIGAAGGLLASYFWRANWNTAGVAGNTFQSAARSATIVPMEVRGSPSQTANLTEWTNSSGAALTVINKDGNIGVGVTSVGASAKLEVASTTQGFLPPRMTTTQKNAIASPARGLNVYDTTTNTNETYNSVSWAKGAFWGLVSATSTYTILTTDYTINCPSGTFSVNLPTAVGISGRVYHIKNSGTGTITVDGNGTETIDGSLTEVMSIQYQSLTVQSDGANWIIL